MDAWQAAEGAFTQLASLSPLTTLLGRSYTASFAETERVHGEDVQCAFFILMMAGYATRSVFDGLVEQPSLDPAVVPLDGLTGRTLDLQDVAGNAQMLRSLGGPIGHLAFADFGSVMTLPSDVWSGYIALATMQLQANLKSRTVPWRELSRERVEGMMRYGYVLRCLDDALDLEPELREDSPHYAPTGATANDSTLTIDVSDLDENQLAELLWDESSVVHVGVMNPEAEHQVADGPMIVLGQEIWDAWSEGSRELAIISTRIGFMLRLAELKLLPEASYSDDQDWLPILEVIQEVMQRAENASPDETGDDDETHARIELDMGILGSASLFASSPETSTALLGLTPGASTAVREKAFDRWLLMAGEKGAIPDGLDRDGIRRLMVYGYAVAVIRQAIMAIQERAGR